MKSYQKPSYQLKSICTPTKKKVHCFDVSHDMMYIEISTNDFVLIWNISKNAQHLKLETKYFMKHFCKFSDNSQLFAYSSDQFQVSLINIYEPQSKITVHTQGNQISICRHHLLLTQGNCFKIIEFDSYQNMTIPVETNASYFIYLMKGNSEYFCCIYQNYREQYLVSVAFVKIWHIQREKFCKAFRIFNYYWPPTKIIFKKTLLIIFYHNNMHQKQYLLLYNHFNNKLVAKLDISTYISQMNFSDDDSYLYLLVQQGLAQLDLSKRAILIQNLEKKFQYTISNSGKFLIGLNKKEIAIQTLI